MYQRTDSPMHMMWGLGCNILIKKMHNVYVKNYVLVMWL